MESEVTLYLQGPSITHVGNFEFFFVFDTPPQKKYSFYFSNMKRAFDNFFTLPPSIANVIYGWPSNLFLLLEGPILPSLHFQRPNFPSGNDWSIRKRTDNLQCRGFQIDNFVFQSGYNVTILKVQLTVFQKAVLEFAPLCNDLQNCPASIKLQPNLTMCTLCCALHTQYILGSSTFYSLHKDANSRTALYVPGSQ